MHCMFTECRQTTWYLDNPERVYLNQAPEYPPNCAAFGIASGWHNRCTGTDGQLKILPQGNDESPAVPDVKARSEETPGYAQKVESPSRRGIRGRSPGRGLARANKLVLCDD